jgi:sterol desaturase/sphingolipid hydroxylase (fatty acid hydroxylase superfamily)
MKNFAAKHASLIPVIYRPWILLFLATLIIIEIIWNWRADKQAYNLKETLANTVILLGFQASKIVFAGYQLTVLGFASSISIFKMGHNAWSFAGAFVLADFIYYWFHRVSHVWMPLWAFHHVHHSSPRMNLTSAYRLNWFSALVSPLFFVPLALLGFPPDYIVLSYVLNLLYQFFLHTEAIGKLGRMEGFIDTPSAHRVHHGQNDIYIDKNFGGVFMWWDRLFNTYQPETEKVKYGIPGEAISYNPFRLVLQGFINLFARKKAPAPNN